MRPIKVVLSLAIKAVMVLIALVLLYFFAAFVLSSIPVNKGEEKAGDMEIPMVYLVSNGVHVDLAVPLSDPNTDWNRIFNLDQLKAYSSLDYAYIGWGEENFYIHTPEWSDLTFSTAFKALFTPSNSALHLHLGNKPNGEFRKLILNRDQYNLLVQYIMEAVVLEDGTAKRIGNYSYTGHDAFYYGTQKYHLFLTCNSWMNRGLKRSGIRSCVWTPFAFSLLGKE